MGDETVVLPRRRGAGLNGRGDTLFQPFYQGAKTPAADSAEGAGRVGGQLVRPRAVAFKEDGAAVDVDIDVRAVLAVGEALAAQDPAGGVAVEQQEHGVPLQAPVLALAVDAARERHQQIRHDHRGSAVGDGAAQLLAAAGARRTPVHLAQGLRSEEERRLRAAAHLEVDGVPLDQAASVGGEDHRAVPLPRHAG